MDHDMLLSRLAVALGIGLLVGLERGWRTRGESDHQRAAGLRTFALTGLLGGTTGAISQHVGGGVIGLAFLGFSLPFAAFHWMEARAERNVSATSVIAGLLTFMLGVLAVIGDLSAAIAGAVAMTLLLALRDQLHRWVETLSWSEIRAVLTLLAMSFLLLPVLPNRTIDPWQAVNPYSIWLLAIMIGSLSFAGYVAVKMFGDRLGVMMAAVAGGLASSTATTVTLARLGKAHVTATALISAGILTAGLVMLLRVALLTAILSPALVARLAPPLLAGGMVMLAGIGLLLLRNGDRQTPAMTLANPLELATAVKLAALMAIIILAARLAESAFGARGVLAAAALAGLVDVDAAVVSLTRLSAGAGMSGVDALAPALAAMAILLAAAVNTLVKSGLAWMAGGTGIGLRVTLVNLVSLAAGLLFARW